MSVDQRQVCLCYDLGCIGRELSEGQEQGKGSLGIFLKLSFLRIGCTFFDNPSCRWHCVIVGLYMATRTIWSMGGFFCVVVG